VSEGCGLGVVVFVSVGSESTAGTDLHWSRREDWTSENWLKQREAASPDDVFAVGDPAHRERGVRRTSVL